MVEYCLKNLYIWRKRMLNEMKQFVLDKTAENDKKLVIYSRTQRKTAYMTGSRDVAGQAAFIRG